VVEARRRIGGRVLSFNDANGTAFIPGRNVEGGAELIGLNHPTWQAYAKQFKLPLLDVSESEAPPPVYLQGRMLGDEEASRLYEEMEAPIAAFTADAAGINADQPWLSPNAAKWDSMSPAQRLESVEASDLAKYATGVQLAADNAAPADRQSYLGLLASIKGGGLDKYWTHSETHRCRGGNQSLAFALATAIGDEHIMLGTPVAAISIESHVALVTLADGRVLEADEVVLAAPPSLWSSIMIAPELPRTLTPQMGLAMKYLTQVRSRFWEQQGKSPDAFSDGPLAMTWESTDGQTRDGPVGLTGFTGGPACVQFLEARAATGREELERLYPGFSGEFVQERVMAWPRDPWTRAGYSFPAPGQVMAHGPTLHEGLGRLHFAGEHTCYQFCGYMEGALFSGARVARQIASRANALS
jgi:monoamine oxidase